MKSLFFSITLLLSSQLLIAQTFNLPVSTTSEPAQKAYEAATYLASNLRFEAARAELNRALELDPDFFMVYAYMYQVLASNGEKEGLMEKALSIDTQNFTEAENVMRRQMLVWKENPEAPPTEAMKALVTAYPNTPEAYEWAALHATFTTNDHTAGLTYAEKVIALDPNYPPIYNVLGYLRLYMDQMDEAKAAFEQYLELAPAEPNAHDSMGEYYMLTKDYVKSAGYYEQAVALGMESSQSRVEQAIAMQNPVMAEMMENKAIVEGIYRAFSRGDMKAFMDALSPNVIWYEAEGNALADENPYVGRKHIMDGIFARIGAEYEYYRVEEVELHPMANDKVL
ncbi:MAG: tetratricopeptide repeat protein, partial [Bacteroidota bacterium]